MQSPILRTGLNTEQLPEPLDEIMRGWAHLYGALRVLSTMGMIFLEAAEMEGLDSKEAGALGEAGSTMTAIRDRLVRVLGPCEFCKGRGWLVEEVGTDFRVVACPECKAFRSAETARAAALAQLRA